MIGFFLILNSIVPMALSKSDKDKLKKLGERVKSLRNEKGLTLKELAYSINKDPQNISRIEMGDVNPGYLFLLALCEGLEVDIKELVDF